MTISVKRKAIGASLKALPERQVQVTVSTDQADRVGDIVVQAGIDLANFKKTRSVLWNHNQDEPVAECVEIGLVQGKLQALVQFPPAGVDATSDRVYGLIKSGIVNAASIGFLTIEAEPVDGRNASKGLRITASELLEFSFVSVPANPGAVITARAMPPGAPPRSPTTIKAPPASPAEMQRARRLEVRAFEDENSMPIFAEAKNSPYEKDRSLVVGAMIKMAALSKSQIRVAIEEAGTIYGESHPVTVALQQSKAMSTAAGAAGGFMVPPQLAAEVIPFLYAQSVVRKAGPRIMGMPNGIMGWPKGTGTAQAGYLGEAKPIPASQPVLGQVTASAKKLAGLVLMSNDLLHYADPSADALVRDDLGAVLATAEDAAFLRGTGTAYSPRGMRYFALPANVFTSNPAYTAATIAAETTQMVMALRMANIPMVKPTWFWSPRTEEYLYNAQNAQALYIYRDEMKDGKFGKYPFLASTQIPVNLTVGGNGDCSEIMLADAAQLAILESRSLELAVAWEGSVTDPSTGQVINLFERDMSAVRAISAHDFQTRYDEAIAVMTGVRWGQPQP